MLGAAALLLFAVELGGVFGSASATVISITDESMQFELEVEVVEVVDSVLAHLALPGEPTVTLPLLDRGSGIYGITTELKKADYMVVFEALGETSSQSQPVSLTGLGAEFGDVNDVGTSTTADAGGGDETNDWLWLAIAFAAASLSVLAIWVLVAKKGSSEDHEV